MAFAWMFRGAVLLAAAIGASAAWGDAECVKGYRDTTAAEREAMLGVMQTAKAALPGAPEGWIIGGYEELSPIGSICKDGGTEGRSGARRCHQPPARENVAAAGSLIRAGQ
jgi:hypothetical protein